MGAGRPSHLPEQLGPRVVSWASMLDERAREQALRTAGLAVIDGHVALMPDAHYGMGATIGSVIPTRSAIIPAAVGVDIGCGVVAAQTSLDAADMPDDLRRVLDDLAAQIPAGLGYWHAEEDPTWRGFLAEHGLPERLASDARLRERAGKQFGTLGSGNHFLEVCVDERAVVWLMLHSGSRGPGNTLAMHHIEVARSRLRRTLEDLPDPDLAALVQGTDEFAAYIADLQWAQAYARASRRRMLEVAHAVLRTRVPTCRITQVIDNHHNFARREQHDGRELWITRKGAISARAGELGVVPGSMGTGSYIVRGLGNPASYHSAAHGAGRAMSRNQARRTFDVEDIEAAMAGRTWLVEDAARLLDEIPGAYKDLDQVMADQTDLVEVVHRLTTVVNYKGVERGSRRGIH